MGSDKAKTWGAVKRDEYLWKDPETVLIVGYDTADRSRADHPLWDERATNAVDELLVASMVEYGFPADRAISCVLDGKDPTTGQPRVLASDGRRRTKAARKANKIRIERGMEPFSMPCMPMKLGQPGDQMIRTIMGNVGRLDDNPVTKGQKALDLLSTGHRTEEQVAILFCTSVKTLRSWMKVLDRHPDVVDAVRRMILPLSAATAMDGMSQIEQKDKLVELLPLLGTKGGAQAVAESIEKTSNGRTRVRASLGKVQSRKAVETFKAKIEESDTTEAQIARAMLAWFAGDAAALERWPWLAEVAKEVATPTKAPKGDDAKKKDDEAAA